MTIKKLLLAMFVSTPLIACNDSALTEVDRTVPVPRLWYGLLYSGTGVPEITLEAAEDFLNTAEGDFLETLQPCPTHVTPTNGPDVGKTFVKLGSEITVTKKRTLGIPPVVFENSWTYKTASYRCNTCSPPKTIVLNCATMTEE